jgi:hypothetical protein
MAERAWTVDEIGGIVTAARNGTAAERRALHHQLRSSPPSNLTTQPVADAWLRAVSDVGSLAMPLP